MLCLQGFFEFTVVRREMGSYDAISSDIHFPDGEIKPMAKLRCQMDISNSSADSADYFNIEFEKREPLSEALAQQLKKKNQLQKQAAAAKPASASSSSATPAASSATVKSSAKSSADGAAELRNRKLAQKQQQDKDQQSTTTITTTANEISEDSAATVASIKATSDPVDWFQASYSTRDNLQTAQEQFQQALKIAVKIANLKIQMEQARQQYVQLSGSTTTTNQQ